MIISDNEFNNTLYHTIQQWYMYLRGAITNSSLKFSFRSIVLITSKDEKIFHKTILRFWTS